MPIFAPEFIARFKGGAGAAAGGLRAALRWSGQAALTAVLTVGLLLAVQHGCPPPGPVPPAPPTPPGPTPPADPFVKALQAAYDAEADPQKAQQKASLASLYRQSAEAAQAADLATWGALWDKMDGAARTLGLSGKLMGLQAVAQADLKGALPARRDAPLDAAGRQLAAKEFKRVSDALEKLK